MGDWNRDTSRVRLAQSAGWIVALILAFLLGQQWSHTPEASLVNEAHAQGSPMAGARGIYAFTGQIDDRQYGLFMLDLEQGTLWCYEVDNSGGTKKLRLIAARTWLYDRHLRDFNNAEPTFQAVQQLLQHQKPPIGDAIEAESPDRKDLTP